MKIYFLSFTLFWLFAAKTDGQDCLIAEYLFSGNAKDRIGVNHGIVYGAKLCPDRFGNRNRAFDFDGTGYTYIEIPASNLILNQYSYALWVNLNSLPQAGAIGFMLSVGSSTSLEGQSLNIQNQYLGTTNTWGGGGYNLVPPNFGLETQSTPIPGQWFHIASVRGMNYAKLFINGVQVDSIGSLAINIPDYGSSTSAYIGIRSNGSSPVNAKIDDIGIYGCALTDIQVDSIYKAQSINDCLIARYLFSGNTQDDIGQNDGTISNVSLCPDRFENPNSAFDFAGTTSSYISIPSSVLANDVYTYALWANINMLPEKGDIGFFISVGSINSLECQSINIQNNYLGTSNTWGGGGYNVILPNFGLETDLTPIPGEWYHIATVRASHYAKLYLNGVQVDSIGTVDAITPDYGSTVRAYLGIRSNGTFPVDAKIDDVEIYGCPLSDEAIDSIYRAQTPTQVRPLEENQRITFFPNPADDVLSITGIFMSTTIRLYDMYGKLVLVTILKDDANIDLYQMAPGVYLMTTECEKVRSFHKVVVSR